MVRNKRGWIRILEATLAVLLVMGVLLVSYGNRTDKNTDSGDYLYLLQREILNEISLNSTFRSLALDSSGSIPQEISDYLSLKVPTNFGARLKICNANLSIQPSCKMELSDFSLPSEFYDTLEKDVFVEEVIISADLDTYSPKRIRLFIWEKN